MILGCRDKARGVAAQTALNASEGAHPGVVVVWELDLASFDSVRDFGRRAVRELPRLDVVVEGAAIYSPHYEACEQKESASVYERQLTVNVLSTFLLALLLLPLLQRTAAATNRSGGTPLPHLVILASNAHHYPPFPEREADVVFEALRGDSNMRMRYHTTKLLVVLATRELASRLKGRDAGQEGDKKERRQQQVIVNFLDTGLCRTALFREESWPMSWLVGAAMWLVGRTAEMGSRIILWAAAAGPETHGRYIEDCAISLESVFVRSNEGKTVQKRVWAELMSILERIEPGVTSIVVS